MWAVVLAYAVANDVCTYGTESRHRRGLAKNSAAETERTPSNPVLFYIDESEDGHSIRNCVGINEQTTATENILKAVAHVSDKTSFRFQRITEEPVAPTVAIWFGAANMAGCDALCQTYTIGMAHPVEGDPFYPFDNFVELGGCYDSVGAIVHEIGHMLGLEHEQKRMDKDAYISVAGENAGWGTWYGQWHADFDNTTHSTFNTSFDFCSIMMYGIKTNNSLWADVNVNVTDEGYRAMEQCMRDNDDIYGANAQCSTSTAIANNFGYVNGSRGECTNVHRQRTGLSKSDVLTLERLYDATATTSAIVTATATTPAVVTTTAPTAITHVHISTFSPVSVALLVAVAGVAIVALWRRV